MKVDSIILKYEFWIFKFINPVQSTIRNHSTQSSTCQPQPPDLKHQGSPPNT
jgi:hypothetical protein